MKKLQLTAFIIAIATLSGCGQQVGQISYSSDDAVYAAAQNTIASSSDTETSPSEEKTTEKATETTTVVLNEPPSDDLFKSDYTTEVYQTITLDELLEDTDIQLENGYQFLDTDQTGEAEVTVSYTYDGKYYEHPVKYTVADTTPPVILNSGWNAYAVTGSVFDLSDFVGYADNYDSSPSLTYTGYVDTSICGDYPLTATVTDSSGNSASWELTISVVDEIPVTDDNNDRIYFEDFIQQHVADNVTFGIDVSAWQGNIDFEAVKNAGCSFVIIRIGHYYDDITMDSYFTSNIASAKAAGLDVGVYIYTTANTEDEIKANAQWIAAQLNGTELDFPIVFDWEEFGNFQQYQMSINDLNNYFELFDDELQQYGYSAMLYSSKNFLNNFWYDHSDCPVWLAHFTDQTDYTGRYNMWQASCYGRIPGIDGDVDLDILYDLAE